MPHPRLKLGRTILVAGLLGLALTACGRRGPLEPPPNAKNAIELPDEDTGAVPVTDASPLGKPKKTNRAIAIPEKPFVLDPLL